MIRRLLALLALFSAVLATPAFAYWEYGHETVAAIAYKNVRPETKRAIDRLLRQQGLLETPTCPARTIEEASVWPDCIKQLGPRFSYAYNWHYQNVNICKPFTLKGNCPDGNCVSAQIERQVKLLQDPKVPQREKVMALAFLVHLVGDLHQPLHAGDKGDLGGNRAKSDYGIYSTDRLNLHSIWDGWLAERAISTPPPLVHVYPAGERATMEAGTIEDWSRENWQIAHEAYAVAYGDDPCAPDQPARGKLDDAAVDKLVPVLRKQVTRGGLRLARLLDEAFAPPASAPARAS
ncbi:S1/P1 nuclease [Sphingomonas sp.]|uniref:S1/P1 nuclease n=1 Tax=Sphingomonas sp. TaxID=28214 RepID=UPI001EBE6796|nr:S1/P1 nuclease [Sphingomonas sp.]MBX3595706.1 S1/P1 nuclease [Sphingomonas sp.]